MTEGPSHAGFPPTLLGKSELSRSSEFSTSKVRNEKTQLA